MNISFVLKLGIIIVFAVILNGRQMALAQELSSEEINRQNNTKNLRRLMEEFQDIVTTLRLERQAYYSRKQKKDEVIDDLRVQILSLKETDENLKTEFEEIEKEIDNLNSENKKLESVIMIYKDKETELSKLLISYGNILRREVNDGIPFLIAQRRAKLDAISSDITTAKQTNIANTCNQLWDFCKDELRLATTSEIYRDRIQLENGRKPHAEFLRVGKIIHAFKTEDDKDWGVWLGKDEKGREMASSGWKLNTSKKSLHSIQKAINMLSRRHPPEIINFPVTISNANILERSDNNDE